MQTLEAINKRASLKTHVSVRDVEQDMIDKILDAARSAPSSRNRQPWRFVVVKGKEAVETLVSRAFSETNQVVREATVIIIACAHPDDMVQYGTEYYLFDIGMAVENMLLAATDLGLVTHLMRGVNRDELKKTLGIPHEVEFVVATPLAYPAEGSYEEAAKERLSQRARKDLQELVYLNAWGKPF
jgi:nitroreductase